MFEVCISQYGIKIIHFGDILQDNTKSPYILHSFQSHILVTFQFIDYGWKSLQALCYNGVGIVQDFHLATQICLKCINGIRMQPSPFGEGAKSLLNFFYGGFFLTENTTCLVD